MIKLLIYCRMLKQYFSLSSQVTELQLVPLTGIALYSTTKIKASMEKNNQAPGKSNLIQLSFTHT